MQSKGVVKRNLILDEAKFVTLVLIVVESLNVSLNGVYHH